MKFQQATGCRNEGCRRRGGGNISTDDSTSFILVERKMKIFQLFFLCLPLPIQSNRQNLVMLTLLQHNDGKLAMPACNEAIRIVLEHANSRSDVLPDFHLTNQVADEGVAARESNRAIIDFERSLEKANQSKSIAPILFGPTRACDFSGLTSKHLGYSTVSPQCHGSHIVQMREMFNLPLFSIQQPGYISLYSLIYFTKFIGKWNEIGLMTLRNNINLLKDAEIVERIATESGVKILLYDNEMQVSRQSIVNMKNANVRVLAVTIGQPAMCLKIWCWAYQEGMRAPTHIFLFHTFNCVSMDLSAVTIPEGCTKEEMETQVGASFAVGNSLEHVDSVGNVETPLGYNYEEFEKEFEMRSFGKGFKDPQFRHACHDSALLGVLGMNATEPILNEKYNTSLANFEENRELIQQVLADSMLGLHFSGFRIGTISYLGKAKHISESNYIIQVHKGNLRYLYELKTIADENGMMSLDSVKIVRKIADPIWPTLNGMPPKDLSNIVKIELNCGKPLIVVFAIINGILSIFQISTSLFSKQIGQFSMISKLFITFGFLLVNLGTIANLFGQHFFIQINCHVSFPIILYGISIVTFCLTKFSFSFCAMKHREKKSIRNNSKHSSSISHRNSSGNGKKQSAISLKKVTISISNSKSLTILWALAIVMSTGLLLVHIIFLPFELETIETAPFFNEKSDSYEKNIEKHCQHSRSIYLTSAILLVDFLLLLSSSWTLFNLAKTPGLASNENSNIFRKVGFSVLNATLALPSGFLIMAVASNAPNCIQIGIFSSFLFIFSSICHFIIFKPF